jgi:hypothetical protein
LAAPCARARVCVCVCVSVCTCLAYILEYYVSGLLHWFMVPFGNITFGICVYVGDFYDSRDCYVRDCYVRENYVAPKNSLVNSYILQDYLLLSEF